MAPIASDPHFPAEATRPEFEALFDRAPRSLAAMAAASERQDMQDSLPLDPETGRAITFHRLPSLPGWGVAAVSIGSCAQGIPQALFDYGKEALGARGGRSLEAISDETMAGTGQLFRIQEALGLRNAPSGDWQLNLGLPEAGQGLVRLSLVQAHPVRAASLMERLVSPRHVVLKQWSSQPISDAVAQSLIQDAVENRLVGVPIHQAIEWLDTKCGRLMAAEATPAAPRQARESLMAL